MSPILIALSMDVGTITTASNGQTIQYLYDGDQLFGEYVNGGVARRYVHGVGVDDPLVWYEGWDLNDRRWLHANHQGSIVAVSENSGNINGSPMRYGSFGEPDTVTGWGGSRFRYTGQTTVPGVALYHYKARVYDPKIGRFLQTDPIGYEDDMNVYAYVGNDPVNSRDPSGMRNCKPDDKSCIETPESRENPSEPEENSEDTDEKDVIVVTAQRNPNNTSGKAEKFFVVTTTDIKERKLTQRTIDCPGGDSVTVGTPGTLPSGASAAHSHPSNHSGVPGPGDNNFGNTSNTGYLMTPSRAYAIDRASNGTYRTRILSGAGLSASEHGELVGNMQNWESGNSSDSSKTFKQRFCQW